MATPELVALLAAFELLAAFAPVFFKGCFTLGFTLSGMTGSSHATV